MEHREYRYELHCHTKEVSRCGRVPAADIVRAYKEKGYDGIVITDHYSDLTFRGRSFFCPQRHIERYLSGYRNALQAAGDNFTVLLGMELRFYATVNDYLVYGVSEDFLRNSGNLLGMYQRRFFRMADKNGLLVLEAHPFRAMHTPAKRKYLHGCEVFNGKDRNPEINRRAQRWYEKCGFSIRAGGSDFHDYPQLALGGIAVNEPIKSNADLIRVLKSGNFRILNAGE